jgi:DNA modification methylase
MNLIEFGDCRETMRRWKEQGIKAQTCVTSPPYYGLRDYGHDGQIGLEETPEEYIAAMVEVFRCVWNVLEDDGTLWLNIGDSYCGTGSKGDWVDPKNPEGRNGQAVSKTQKLAGYKSKDLIGIPWMLAFALRADGWYLRQDIIWHKPNPMPESVQDRCTKAHEYIFLLSKSPKYYYDIDSIKEPLKGEPETRNKNAEGYQADYAHGDRFSKGERVFGADGMANKRSVWTVNTKPYKGAHFAVFPQELIEPCIMAGAPVGGVVLDPFMGSGTTAQVAKHLNRQYLGCELNLDYKPLQDKRLCQFILDFA